MTSMIERVAKAIDEASQPPGQKDYKILMENAARAAIEAMREPTPEMEDLYPPGADKKSFMESYRAMIDAALARS